MIIKVKIGDLTARQIKAICLNYKGCVGCPLLVNRAKCAVEFGETIPLDYDLEREIEVSTDIVSPNESEPFEKRIERMEKSLHRTWQETQRNRHTLARLARILGYQVGDVHRLGKWREIYARDRKDAPDVKEFNENRVVFSTTDESFNPPPSQSRCEDCVKFDECKDHTTEDETFYEVGGCKAFERKESKQGKKNDHCDTCLFYGEDGICVVHKEKIARPYKKSCPAYLPSAVQLDLDEKLFQLKARRAYVYNYSFDTTVPCKDCVYCNPRTKKCFINYPKPETWDGEDGDYYCGHGVERSKSE